MKLVLSACIFMMASVSLAAFQFKTNSELPPQVQKEIINFVNDQCWETNLHNWLIEEVKFQKAADKI